MHTHISVAAALPPTPPRANRFVHHGSTLLRAYASCERHVVRKLAEEYLAAAAQHTNCKNYGNAIHQANIVLGLLEVERGCLDRAERHLTDAARTPGSPQLTAFGPNMLLARKLLEAGRREPVLDYLKRCRKIWKLHFGRLWLWAFDVRLGRTPNFGANLHHLLDYKSFG
ncbi:hypothetical protein [Lewinella sp. IMCC34183]|uniref:hypothetical protein n=1 Tax=Lewinella sp. IMCC34183 TaxID=2248762 RepID=UPI000E241229|nr:hypothetical protein [Lewinella sp. IMCC34183]